MSKFNRIEELQHILHNDKTNFQARREFAVLLLDCNFPEDALQQFLYLSKVFTEDSGIFYNLGITYEKLRDLNNAEKSYLKAIELSPKEIDAHYNLGLVYMDKKEYAKAIECFENVLEQDKNDSNSYFSIAICYLKEGKNEAAKYYLQRTIELNDEDIYAHFYLGNILKEEGDVIGAVNEFYRVLDISPDYSWAYFNLASIDYEQGNIDGAIDNLEKTLEYNSKDIEAYKIYIKILLSNNNPQKALEIASRATANCPEEGDLHYVLAQVHKINNNLDEYLNSLNEALKYNTTLSISPKAIKQEIDSFNND